MKQRIIASATMVLVIMGMVFIGSCNNEEENTTDKALYEMALQTDGYVWYKHDDALLDKSSGSGHDKPYFRTRFNSVAAQMLDSAGGLVDGTSFPEGSVIVKELFGSSNSFDRFAVLYKKSDHQDADANGWVWGYIDADGGVAFAAAKKGSSCISCHSQSGTIDYILMKKFFP